MIELDDPNDAAQLEIALRGISKAMQNVVSSTTYVNQRPDTLRTLRSGAPKIYAKAQDEFEQTKAIRNQLKQRLSELAVKYPGKQDDCAARDDKAEAFLKQAEAFDQTLQAQYRAIQGNDQVDYAAFGEAAAGTSETLSAATKYRDETLETVAELDQTIIRILADQKIDYIAVVGRSSWCEWNDCYSEHAYKYPPVHVTEKVYEYLDRKTGTIATWKSGWRESHTDLRIDRSMWSALSVSEKKSMDRWHDYAEFWIEDLEAKAFHRYTEIVDGEESLTGWKAVSEDTFWAHQEDLGLALFTKPTGMYISEAMKTPEPPGEVLIAEPTIVDGQPTGRNGYGYWGDGGFWVWYGQYRLISDLLGGGRYGYNDWSSYNRRDRGQPYYGNNDKWGTYGGSTYGNGRYSNSSYAKRNPSEIAEARSTRPITRSSGRPDASVRNAGTASRGRGPGGSGK